MYHVTESGGAMTAEKLETDVDAAGETVTAAAESFSLYTVEFTYNNLQYVMKGDTSVALTEILAVVGLSGEATAVSVSNAELFSAAIEDGAWVVTAHQPFHTGEWMKVTINDVTYNIVVTDDEDDDEDDEEEEAGDEGDPDDYDDVDADSPLVVGANQVHCDDRTCLHYKFVPDTNCAYRFYSEVEDPEMDPRMEIYQGDTWIAEHDDIDSQSYKFNFDVLVRNLSAGTEYTVYLSGATYDEIDMVVYIEKLYPIACAVSPAEAGSVIAVVNNSTATEAAEDATVTLTVNAATGYSLTGLSYAPTAGGAATTIDIAGGDYSFRMPAHAVTVTAAFAEDSSIESLQTGSNDVVIGRSYSLTTQSAVRPYTFSVESDCAVKGELSLDGNVIACNESSDGDNDFIVQWMLEASKTYYFTVSPVDEGDAGRSCSVTVEMATSSIINTGDNDITPGNFYRSPRVSAAGQYRIRTSGAFDTEGVLFRSDGSVLAADTDDGENFCILADLETQTSYYIYAYAADPGDAGETCTLTIEKYDTDSWSSLYELLYRGGTVTLTEDYLANSDDGNLEVPEGVTVTLNLNGYTIDGSGMSGTVYDVIVVQGELTLMDSGSGGELKGNRDDVVYVQGGKFTMNGGAISGGNSGGVYVDEDSEFTITGGTITSRDNVADVLAYGSVILSGTPKMDEGVQLEDSALITIGGALGSDAWIGVKMETPGVFTSGWGDKMADAAPENYFYSLNDGCEVSLSDGGEAQLAEPDPGDALEDGAALSLGQNVVTLGGDYTFTPTETGVYSFQTNGNMDTKGELLLDGERLASDDDGGVESNFMVSWLMEASKTYTLSADAYDSTDNGTACMLSVEKVTPVALSLGDKEIELISGSFYSFTPETAGVYCFSSTGDYDTACTLIQAGSAATDHDSGEGDNFRIIADLSAGTICYLYIFADDDDDEGETWACRLTTVQTPPSACPVRP